MFSELVLNNRVEITVTNFEYGNIQINNGDIKYGTRIDTRNVKITSRKGKKHLTLNHFINWNKVIKENILRSILLWKDI